MSTYENFKQLQSTVLNRAEVRPLSSKSRQETKQMMLAKECHWGNNICHSNEKVTVLLPSQSEGYCLQLKI